MNKGPCTNCGSLGPCPKVCAANDGSARLEQRVPMVHMNGTSGKELLTQLLDAHKAGRAFQNALQEANPNARDYYPLPGHAYTEARDQHAARHLKLKSILDDLEAIAIAVQEQVR